MRVTELFKEEPTQWGLRGDPHLWKEIKEYFEEVVVPSSSAGFERKLIEAYEVITGHRLSERQHFVVESFKRKGMSSGAVSPEFWVNVGIPLLVGRYENVYK